MNYPTLLRTQPAFRRLWLGQVVSELGDWLASLALVSLFPTTGGAAFALAGMFVVHMLPSVLWAPVSGIVADRFPRGSVMVACDVLRAFVAMGYLFVRGPEDAGVIYALVFVQESLTAFFEPARSAAIPQVVSRDALLAANALSGATWSAMSAIGSMLGGFVMTVLGLRAAFVLDSLSFVASALILVSIRIPRVAEGANESALSAQDRFGLGSLREGARYLVGHKPQAATACVKALWGTAGGGLFLMAVYATEVFARPDHKTYGALGLLFAGRGVGSLVGPILSQRVFGESASGLRRGILVGFVFAALGFSALTWAPSALWGAACLVCAHMGGSTCWVNSTQLLQLTVPSRLQGRVFALELAAITATTALSNILAGALIGRGITTLRGATWFMVAAMLAAAAAWAASMSRLGRRLDEAAATAHPA